MRRRVGVGLGIGLAAVVSALLVWRCGRTPERSTAPGTQAAPSAGAGSSQRRLVGPGRDAKSLTRSSLAGTVTDAVTKAPIAGAEVCADGTSPDLADELMRMPFCDETDEHGRYEIANLVPAVYFVHASARTYRPALYHPDGDRQKRFLVVAAGELEHVVVSCPDPRLLCVETRRMLHELVASIRSCSTKYEVRHRVKQWGAARTLEEIATGH